MYVAIVIALLLALPLISIVAQIVLTDQSALHGAAYLALVAKWYVFWAVGARLSLAGLRQIIQPRYTAETILGLKGAESLFFVRELGFANVSMGSVGVVSLAAPSWLTPAATYSPPRCSLLAAALPDRDGYARGSRVKHDFGLALFQLAQHPRHLVLKREFSFAVIGAFAQDKGFDDRVEQVRGQFAVGDLDRFGDFFAGHRALR
jgi:hypothetical protein